MTEIIHGGGSNEQLVVNSDKTQAYGLSGNDTIISGGNSSVLLIGGSGDDSLVMMGGIGTLNGGKGSDTFELTYSANKAISAVIEDLDPSSDKIVINFDGASAPQLTSNTLNNGDVVWTDGGNFNLTLKSKRDNDYFDGEAPEQVWEVLKITNEKREAQGLSALTLSEGLMIGAMSRAQEIAELDEQQKFDEYKHTRPDGSDYFTVIVDDVDKNLSLSAKYFGYAENLQAGAATSEEVMDAWMGSTTHQKNILDNQDENRIQSRKLGVGYNYVAVGSTSSHDRFWTQLFADSLQSTKSVSTADLLTASIQINAVSTAVTLDDDDNDYSNTLNGATIAALDGNDSIINTGVFVSISGGSGADTIDNSGANATICAGTGDDSIQLGSDNLIVYRAGDGNDIISGFNETSKLSIIGDVEYMPVTVDNDVIVNVGGDSITLKDAATLEGIDDYIDGKRKNHFILRNANDPHSNNTISGAIIEARSGYNNKITNSGANVSIDAGDGNDTVNNSGDFATISAGSGNDSIVNNGGSSVLFVYDSGSDTISGFNETSTLRVSDGDYSSIASGNDLILVGATDSIKVLNVAGLSTLNIEDANGEPVTVGDAKNHIGTENADNINNPINNATIQALGSDDTITNTGSNVSINAGDGNDSIVNSGSQVTIDGGDGNDSIDNKSSRVTINSGAGDDSISNSKANVTIDSGDGNDYIANDSASVTIDAGAGDNTITSNGRKVSIVSGTGNDFIDSNGDSVTIDSGAGSDTIHNSGNRVSIVSGDGNDSVNNEGSRVTIRTGAGDDTITNSGDTVAIHYGGGNDIIEGFKETSTLDLGNYAWQTVESDAAVLVYVTSNDETIGTITLKGYVGDLQDNIKPELQSSIEGHNVSRYENDTIITGTAGNDTIFNYGLNVTIEALAGNDSIYNGGNDVSVNGGNGNDSIWNSQYEYDSSIGTNVTMNGGAGNDAIWNYSNSVTVDSGAGDDSIWSTHNMVSIAGGKGDDSIHNEGSQVTIDAGAGNDSIGNSSLGSNTTINGGADDDTIKNGGSWDNSWHDGGDSVTIDGGTGNDSIENWGDSVTIDGGAGNDSITNCGDSVTIYDSAGNDDIYNSGASVTIDSGQGDDSIENIVENVTLGGGEGNDTIYSYGDSVTIEGNEGNDFISNGGILDDFGDSGGSSVTIDAGAGDDYVYNWYGSSVTIDGGAGDDSIKNERGSSITIEGGAGDDSIKNERGSRITIEGGAGNDTIQNGYTDDNGSLHGGGSFVSILGGTGDDYIANQDGLFVSIDAGAGNDRISLSSDSKNNFVRYSLGDGNDTVWGINEDDTLNFLPDKSSVSDPQRDGNDIIYYVGTGSIRLVGAWEKPPKITYGESGTSGGVSGGDNGGNQGSSNTSGGGNGGGSSGGGNGGGSSGGGNGGGSSSGGNGGDNGGNQGSNTSGGGSQNEGKGDTDATQGQSASGSPGRGTSSGRGTSTGISNGGSNNGGSNNGGGYSSRGYNSTDYRRSTTASTPFDVNPFELLKIEARNANQNASTSGNQYIYAGYNQVIDNYQAGEKIFFLTDYTGAFYDGAGNFFFGSSTGALVVQNATDKFIEHYDGAGNSFLKAYAASTAGVIDGRWTTGFEVLNGSAGSDLIFAGDSGSQLLGGTDVVSDTLVGGNGSDVFIVGKNQGADIVLNASSTDVVHLNDATLSDIIATLESDGAITVAFNTGNAIAVQSSEALSATFMLADGSAYRYNHAAKAWQSVNQNIYAGGDQVISNYQSGDKIVFGAEYTGATFDGAGNFLAGSTAGTLIVQNATDKLIDLSDGAGNSFLKAYEATTAGVIDGRGLTGFEVVNGSAGSDAIFAGDNGSQLWGGADTLADTLVGGLGVDVFVGGKAQGADVILNASSADVVHLNDVTLSDLIGSSDDNGTIALAFNTGNVVTAQSSEALSAKFLMADGSAYRYNHVAKTWQNA